MIFIIASQSSSDSSSSFRSRHVRAGAVDENVERAVLFVDRVEQQLDADPIGDVDRRNVIGTGDSVSAQACLSTSPRRPAMMTLAPAAASALSDAEPDARAAAGDEGDFTCELHGGDEVRGARCE